MEKFYTREKKGTMLLSNAEIINSQKGILSEIISMALKNFSFSKGFSEFSLPAKIFSLKTQMEMVPELFGHVQYLKKAVECFNPGEPDPAVRKRMRVERLKNVVYFLVAGIHHTIQAKKPFNLYVGETLQAHLDDGTRIYVEHTKHYPAIDSFYIVNEELGFKIYGAIKLLSTALATRVIERRDSEVGHRAAHRPQRHLHARNPRREDLYGAAHFEEHGHPVLLAEDLH